MMMHAERATRNKWARIIAVMVWVVPPSLFAVGYYNAHQARLEREAELAARSDVEAAVEALRDSANHGHLVIDVDGRVVGFNKALERWTGYTAAEMLGKTLERLMTPEQWRHHDAAYREWMSDPANIGRKVRLSCEIHPKPGSGLSPFKVEVNARSVRPRGRKVLSVALVDRERLILDLTEGPKP